MLSILLEVNQRWLSPTTVSSVFKLLTQQIHRVSSVGAGSFPLIRDSIFSHFVGPLSHIPIQMSSLFLLILLFYCRKFSSSRWADRISLCRSFTRCRAAFSLLCRRFREGFLWYLFSLRVLSTPSFIMRFLRRETARSGFSLRLIFTVNIVLFWLGWSQLPCSCSVSFFLYTSIVPRPVEFVKWPFAATLVGMYLIQGEYSGVPFSLFLVALWFVWDMVWVVMR